MQLIRALTCSPFQAHHPACGSGTGGHVMSTAAQANFWMTCPDHSVLWFIRQLRILKVLDAIITGAALQGITPNQRRSHYTYKNSLILPMIKQPVFIVENLKIQKTINGNVVCEFIIQKQLLLLLWQIYLWVTFVYVIPFLLTEYLLLHTILYPDSFREHFPM